MKHRILYCHCAYARVIPDAVKQEVLSRLAASGCEFEAVPDLCEMSAARDPRLSELVSPGEPVHIAACYPRAVKWLFSSAGSPLPAEGVTVWNMRELPAESILHSITGAQA